VKLLREERRIEQRHSFW